MPVLRYLTYYNNLEKLHPSVLISVDLPILIFSTFRAFNYYSIMGSINYFGQVALGILENNQLKSYSGNSEIETLSTFLEISQQRKLTLQNHVFFKKKNFKIYIYQQRAATNVYCEVLNMNLNVWFDIPSKYIEIFFFIVSVALGIFSERSTDTSCQDFSI